MGNGGAAQSRLIGEDTARHTEADSGPHRRPGKPAGGGHRREGVGEDQIDGGGDGGGIDGQHHQTGNEIGQGHEGHQGTGDLGDAANATDQHQGHQHRDDHPGEPSRDAEGAV